MENRKAKDLLLSKKFESQVVKLTVRLLGKTQKIFLIRAGCENHPSPSYYAQALDKMVTDD